MKRRRSRRRAPKTRFQWIGTLLLWILIMSALLVGALWLTGTFDGKERDSVFSIRSVTVEGVTHYDEEDVIGVSGLFPGKSVLTLNKAKVRSRLIGQFAYITDVEIGQGDSFRDVVITVTEQPVFAATHHEGEWLLIGGDGRLLEKRPIKSDTPERVLQLKLAALNEDLQLGDRVVPDRDWQVIGRLLTAFDEKGLTNVTVIDLVNRNDIRVHWNRRLEIRLGNSTNLEHEIAMVAVTIPRIDEKHGEDACGVLDLRSYADDNSDNNYAVFTPEALVTTTTFPLSTTTQSEATTTTADGSTTAKTTGKTTGKTTVAR